MAGTSLLALLDDIATLLDDVSIMTKVAAKKTAGVLGDDLALNAQQVSGIKAERELPVVWAVAKGSALNKVILVPSALLLSFIFPWLVTPILMLGGAYLCFEGFEKIAHKYLHAEESAKAHHEKLKVLGDPNINLVEYETEKIKGAIRTDFILSAEIIVIALGTVKGEPILNQTLVVLAIAALMTIGVYTLVAGIVKLDDLGIYLLNQDIKHQRRTFREKIGNAILWFAPWLMKVLSVVGTAAMFLVGGGILVHGIPSIHESFHPAQHVMEHIPFIGPALVWMFPVIVNGLMGLLMGAVLVFIVEMVKKRKGKSVE